ncbi:pimeloyl-ACP methyl ester carboxylesterase [Leucobacter luti]|uniref:Pimeloyl-ACP methyl ester carboxylesterase n=1 Tax=Leucobacter luti TaxID=340320 RepID=A0A4R6RSS5_9MICO|nr:alpha/beta fold hydrolase [Leucobacter luti]MCW2287461.1 pimeloyl-ACP methyl ester carboxylesterase [Leucobacter luti]TCK41683.1 pimeloyl-ACP methyl ester carboxylesterase [Leucobacter luti]TDP89347.1 pimeloyl-ACP methyl ester carboxylesterase [Leucobacter luti]
MSIDFPALPASITSERITVAADVQLRVLRAGSGAPLLLVPGWNFSGEVFVHQLVELAAHYEVIALDPRGHGESSKPLTGNNFPQRGRDLAAVIEALDLRSIALAGWSFGVLDVLSYLGQFGDDRVARLILIDEPPRVPFDPANAAEWGEAALSHDGLPAFVQFLSTDRAGFLAYIAADALGVDPAAADSDPAVAKLIADGARTPEHIAIITGAEGLSTDLSAPALAFHETGKPVLFFAKEAWAEAAERWVTTQLPRAEFATIPVHAGFLTEPAAFNARLTAFLG